MKGLFLVLLTTCTLMAVGSSDLLMAVHDGDHAQVQKLLRAGADVNSMDAEGTTALMHSVIESDPAMMKLLLDNGANVNAKNVADSTALMYASTNLAKTRLLLDAGADVKAKNKRGATPMNVAVKTFGATPVLKLLAAKGAEPEAAMMVSVAQKGDLEAIQYLLSLGVSPGDENGGAVSQALIARCEACARLLVEKGAPIKKLRDTGAGVLNEAVKRSMTDAAGANGVNTGSSVVSLTRSAAHGFQKSTVAYQSPSAVVDRSWRPI